MISNKNYPFPTLLFREIMPYPLIPVKFDSLCYWFPIVFSLFRCYTPVFDSEKINYTAQMLILYSFLGGVTSFYDIAFFSFRICKINFYSFDDCLLSF